MLAAFSLLLRCTRELEKLYRAQTSAGETDAPSAAPPSDPLPAGGPAAASIHLGPSWASPEEVADVTVALAALVDDDGEETSDIDEDEEELPFYARSPRPFPFAPTISDPRSALALSPLDELVSVQTLPALDALERLSLT